MACVRLPAPRRLALAMLMVASLLRSLARLFDDTVLADDNDDDNQSRIRLAPLPALPSEMVVDILSIGSVNRLDLLDAQRRTMGSHAAVRNFFNATELDDADDPDCYKELTWRQVQKISRFCRKERPTNNSLNRFMTLMYASDGWLRSKPNPAGWICAIRRPYYGLAKAAKLYARHRQEDLPDWLVVLDDDTYYNMELLHGIFRNRNASDLEVSAGCLLHLPVHHVNFTFPWGGFGAVISKGSLAKLLRPIKCPSTDEDKATCDRLQENIVGELRYFRNGMSLIDLIYAYVSAERYRDVDRWSTGFCMHADWILGYFVSFYNVSRHVEDPDYELVPQARIEPFVKGSEHEVFFRGYSKKAVPGGLCKNEGVCREGQVVCHKANASWIEQETDRWRQLAPHRFRDVA